jgi:hypothetical protein
MIKATGGYLGFASSPSGLLAMTNTFTANEKKVVKRTYGIAPNLPHHQLTTTLTPEMVCTQRTY